MSALSTLNKFINYTQYAGLAISGASVGLHLYQNRSPGSFHTARKIDQKISLWAIDALASWTLTFVIMAKVIDKLDLWGRVTFPKLSKDARGVLLLPIVATPFCLWITLPFLATQYLNDRITSFQKKAINRGIPEEEKIEVKIPPHYSINQVQLAYRIFSNIAFYFFFKKQPKRYLFLVNGSLQTLSWVLLSRTPWMSTKKVIEISEIPQSWRDAAVEKITFSSYLPMLKPIKAKEGSICVICLESATDALSICGNDSRHLLHAKCVSEWMSSKGKDIFKEGAHLTHNKMVDEWGKVEHFYHLKVLKKSIVTCPTCRSDLGSFKLNAKITTRDSSSSMATISMVDQIT